MWRFDRALLTSFADWLAVGVAVMLPWSTSATGIFIAAWLVAALASADPAAVKRELLTAAGGLPVLLWCLGALGMLWADVAWHDRFAGFGSFHRLLMIPLLLAQFRHSERGEYVIYGFFVSASVVLIASVVLVWTGIDMGAGNLIGVPTHDDIFQNTEFVFCAFGLLGVAFDQPSKRTWLTTAACIAGALLYLADIVFVEFSRTSLVVIPVLVVLLGWRLRGWRGVLLACFAAGALAAISWVAVPNVRGRLNQSAEEMHGYLASGAATSLGMHVAFEKESLAIIAAAPIVGHGTGSIAEQFHKMTAGKSGAAGVATVNPHNQTFAIAIQLGLTGAAVLWAMWLAHLLLFRGGSNAAWFGTVVVVENIVSSIANSHLFDFNHGWLYVFAVGTLGGMALRQRDAPSARRAAMAQPAT